MTGKRALQIHHVIVGNDESNQVLPELFLALWAPIDASSAGANLVVSAEDGRKIRAIGIKYSCSDAVSLKWQSGSSDIGPMESYAARGGMSDYWGPHGCFFETAIGEPLNLNLSDAVQISGWLCYLLV